MADANQSSSAQTNAPSDDEFERMFREAKTTPSDKGSLDDFDKLFHSEKANSAPDILKKLNENPEDSKAFDDYANAVESYYKSSPAYQNAFEVPGSPEIKRASTLLRIGREYVPSPESLKSFGTGIGETLSGLGKNLATMQVEGWLHPWETLKGMAGGTAASVVDVGGMPISAGSWLKEKELAASGKFKEASQVAAERARDQARTAQFMRQSMTPESEAGKAAFETSRMVAPLAAAPLAEGLGIGRMAAVPLTEAETAAAAASALKPSQTIVQKIAGKVAEKAGTMAGAKVAGAPGAVVGGELGEAVGEAVSGAAGKASKFGSAAEVDRTIEAAKHAIGEISGEIEVAAGSGESTRKLVNELAKETTRLEKAQEAKNAITEAVSKAEKAKQPGEVMSALKSTAMGGALGGVVGASQVAPGESVAPAVAGGALYGAGAHGFNRFAAPLISKAAAPVAQIGRRIWEGPAQKGTIKQPPVLETPVATPTEPAKPLTEAEAPKPATPPVITAPKPVAATLGDHPNTGNAEAPVMLEKLGLPKHDEPSLATPTEGGLKSMSTANEALAKKAIMGRESPYLNMIDLPNGKEIKSIGYGDGFIIIKVKKPTLDKFQTYLYKGTLEEAQQIINSPKPYETFLKGIKVNNETSRVVDLHDRILTDASQNYGFPGSSGAPSPAPAPSGPLSGAPVAEKAAPLAAMAEQPKTEAQQLIEARSQVMTPEKAELQNQPRLIEEEYTRKLKEESDKIINELKGINDRLEAEAKSKSESELAKAKAESELERSSLSKEESAIQTKIDQVIEKHGISYDALVRIRERMTPEEFGAYLDQRIKAEPTDLSSASDWIANIKEKIAQKKADLDAKEQAYVERGEDLIAAVEGEERSLRSPIGAENLRQKLQAEQEASKPKPLESTPPPQAPSQPLAATPEPVKPSATPETPAKPLASTSTPAADLIAQAEALGIKVGASTKAIILGKEGVMQKTASDALAAQIKSKMPPEEPPAAPAVKEPTPPAPAPASKPLAAVEAPVPETKPEPAPTPKKPAKAAKTTKAEEPVEQSSPHDDYIEKVDNALIDPEVKKSTITSLANKANQKGLITDKELNAVREMAKDRDMGPEDVGSELNSYLSNNAKTAKKESQTQESGAKEKIKYDPKDGIGATPDNQEINYKGYVREITPDQFLKSAQAIESYPSLEVIKKKILNGEAVGNPTLYVKWNGGKGVWKTVMHEGRNRSAAIKSINPDEKMPVHIIPRGGMRAKDITPEMKNAPIISEEGNTITVPGVEVKKTTATDTPPSKKEPVVAKVTESPTGKFAAPTPALDKKVSALATPKQLEAQKQYLGDALAKLGKDAPEVPEFKNKKDAESYAKSMDRIKQYENIAGRYAESQVKQAKTEISDLASKAPKITIQVPGDGEFRIVNDKSHIEAFADVVEKSFGKGIKYKKPANRSVPKLTPEELAEHTMTPEEAKNFGKPSK